MRDYIKKNKLDIILALFCVYFITFMDRYVFFTDYTNYVIICKWLIYYVMVFILYYVIIHFFRTNIIYIWKWIKSNIKGKNKYPTIIVFGLLLISIILRIVMAVKHFTHCDDFGVVSTMFSASSDYPWERIRFFLNWTYAPLQYTLSNTLLNPKFSYELNLFLGRLPSLLCGIGSVLLLVKNYIKINSKNTGKNKIPILILFVVLLGLSWENIIYSVQMCSYEIAILMLFLLIDKYLDVLEDGNWKNHLMLAFIAVLACHSQYQMFVFVFSMYAALFVINILNKDKKGITNILIFGALTVVFCIPMLYTILKCGLLGRSINWNGGIDKQFILKYNSSIIQNVYRVIKYFIVNNFICIRSFFVYKTGNIISNLITTILYILILLGVVNANKNKDNIKKSLFFDILVVIYTVMILIGSLILSPSRHNIVLVPIYLYFIYFGIIFVININKIKFMEKYFVKFLTVVLVLIFMIGFISEYKNRINPIKTSYFEELVNEYEPITISSSYVYLHSTYYLNIPSYIATVESFDTKSGMRVLVNDYAKNRNVMLIYDIANKLDQGIIDSSIDYIEKIGLSVEYKDRKKWKILYKLEKNNNTEIEYAYNVFSNRPNNFYCYVVEMEME